MALLWNTAAGRGMDWDEVGEQHPIYRTDEETGEGHGDAVNWLAHSTPEDPEAERHSEHELTFHHERVDPYDIQAAYQEPGDYRVQRARHGYANGHDVPPVLLVKRHGEYHVADGHHRARGARGVVEHVDAIVAHSPYDHLPFGEREY